MDNYLNPYRRLLDKGEDKRLFRLQYHDRLLYEKNGAWYKSLWSEKLEGFIKEYEGHKGLNICVDEKLHYPLHCFVIDPYTKNAIVEFYLPAAKGNGGNAIFLALHLPAILAVLITCYPLFPCRLTFLRLFLLCSLPFLQKSQITDGKNACLKKVVVE